MRVDSSSASAFCRLVLRQTARASEAHLLEAAELGRQLALSNVRPEEVAGLQDAAIRAAREEPNFNEARVVQVSAALLSELFVSYGVTLRQRLDELGRSRETLVEAEALYRAIVEVAPDIIMVLASDGTIEFINRTISGLTKEDVLGKNALTFLSDPDKATMSGAMSTALQSGELCTYEVSGPGPDGSVRRYRSRLRRLGGPDAERLLLFTQDTADAEESIRRLEDAKRELEESKLQLLHAQKMEALGRLAGGVAHDFNNLLTSIVSFSRFVHDDLPNDDPRRDDLREVLNAAHSAAKLTNQLLSFSRRRPVEPETVELGAALRKIGSMLRRTIGETVELVMLLESARVPVVIDPSQFEQVIFNLAVNAHDAMPDGGTLTVQVRKGSWAEVEAKRSGSCALLTVMDTGAGIPDDVRERIFEPFFSTKGERGTGLGLATSYGIVKQAGGELSVRCPAEGGTCFTIALPLATSTSGATRASMQFAAVRPSLQPKGLALVVDDQPAILKTLVRTLKGAGIPVKEAHTAEECLALVSSLEAQPMLLVSDVVLPGLSGIELASRLRKQFPELRVLLTSGYMGEEFSQQLQTDEGTAFLPKPFSGPQLLSRINLLFA